MAALERRPAPSDRRKRPERPGLNGSRAVNCPWCGSGRVERIGAFGSHLMASQYVCLDCRSPFEAIRRPGP